MRTPTQSVRAAQPAQASPAMAAPSSPAEFAREAIRRLVSTKIPPTPENFARAYRDVSGDSTSEAAAGGGSGGGHSEAEKYTHNLIELLQKRSPDSPRVINLKKQITTNDWSAAQQTTESVLDDVADESSAAWSRLLGQLLTQLDTPTAGWTRARKLTALQHVLTSAGESGKSRERLERLMKTWGQAPQTAKTDIEVAPNPDLPPAEAALALWREAALLAIGTIGTNGTNGIHSAESGRNLPEARQVLDRLRAAESIDGEHLKQLRDLITASDLQQQREGAVRKRLHNLLKMLCASIATLADDEGWVRSQITLIGDMLDAPLDEVVLIDAEEKLRDAIARQNQLKDSLTEAKEALRETLTSLIHELGMITEATGSYYDKIEGHAATIRSAKDLGSLSKVVADLLTDTSNMRDGIQQTHRELKAAKQKTEEYEEKIRKLERELTETHNLVSSDPLTQVLNRRGFEEAFAVEEARAQRDSSPLAVAILDIDNFKKINDSIGHGGGDEALKHLAACIRQELRPTDTVARYGGEEFVILMHETALEAGAEVLTRLQRQLTRALFLHNEQRILITFSAGITEYRPGESREAAVGRADAALYLAKGSGKNRVVLG